MPIQKNILFVLFLILFCDGKITVFPSTVQQIVNFYYLFIFSNRCVIFGTPGINIFLRLTSMLFDLSIKSLINFKQNSNSEIEL